MNMLNMIRNSLRRVLLQYTATPDKYLNGVRRSHREGVDYQINPAVTLAKDIDRDPVDLAREIAEKL